MKKYSLSLSLSRNRPLNSKFKNKKSGFTLLEILLVVGIIAILAGIVIVAINPSKQLATVRNTERKSDIKQISNALQQYYIDNAHYPTSTPATLTDICDTGSSPYPASSVTCGSLFNLSVLVPTYLTAIPKDPQATTTGATGYQFMKDASKRIAVSAPLVELGSTIAIGNVTPVVVDNCSHTDTDQNCWSADDITSGYTTWSSDYTLTNAQSDTDGASNQSIIMSSFDTGSNYPAFEACHNLREGGHSDWYLPAKNQLVDAFNNSITGFQSDIYWSSTEDSDHPEGFAWYVYMDSGSTYINFKDDPSFLVRCLR